MGKVDEFDNAVHEGVTERDKGIEQAVTKAEDENLSKLSGRLDDVCHDPDHGKRTKNYSGRQFNTATSQLTGVPLYCRTGTFSTAATCATFPLPLLPTLDERSTEGKAYSA